ncbi:MAG TPA: hypothetical protein VMH84_04070 [Xanthobacteraceae bacterium]|nr:hypothetical protein [Xanthobacteraceae bacterium]
MREFFRSVFVSAYVAALAAPSAAGPAVDKNLLPVAPAARLRPPAATPSSPRPYQVVAATFPAAPEDASLDTFRQAFATVVKARVYGELARLVTSQGFFWDRDFNGSFDGQQSAVDNLAAAVHLEHGNGNGWVTLAGFAAETKVASLTGRPGIVCAPAEPSFDQAEFDRLLDTTRTSARDWAVPRADKTPVYAAARSNAKVKDTLAPTLVRVVNSLAKDNEPESLRAAWVRVMTPSGRVGYVAPGALMPLSAARLCYGQDGFGRWHIAGFVGAGD